jgi:tetratricopeptide (TPR) repeat protein
LHALGNVLLTDEDPGNLDRARACYEESLSLAREVGALRLIGSNLNALGELARFRGELGQARESYEQSLAIHRRESKDGSAVALVNLGFVAFAQGDIDAARQFFEESLALSRELGIKALVASCLEGLAGVDAVRGDPERAARLLGAAEALRTAIHQPIEPADRADYERFVAAARSRLDEASFKAAWEAGAHLSLEEATELALAEPRLTRSGAAR